MKATVLDVIVEEKNRTKIAEFCPDLPELTLLYTANYNTTKRFTGKV